MLAFSGVGGSRVYEQMISSFTDPEWRSAVVCLLAAINATFAHPDYVRPKATLQESDLAEIGAALATRSYRPDRWLQSGTAVGMPALRSDKPAIDPKSDYRLLALRALRESVSRISVRFGGIVFEDPFYALLACFNVGAYSKLLLLPRVISVDQAWQQRSAIVKSLAKGAYSPEKLFVQCKPVAQNRTGLPMEALAVRGDLLQQIQQVGRGNIQDTTGFSRYELYEFVPEQ
jgi:hypothetical protein